MNADKTFRICDLPKTTQDRLYKAMSYVSKEVRSTIENYSTNKYLFKAFDEVKGLNHDIVYKYFNAMLQIHGYHWDECVTDKDIQTNRKVVFWYFVSWAKGAQNAREALEKKSAC